MRGPSDRRGLQFEMVLNLVVVMSTGLATVALVCLALSARTVERESVDRLRLVARQLQRVALEGSLRLSDLAVFSRTVDPGLGAGTWRILDREGRSVWRGGASAGGAEDVALAESAWLRGEAVEGGLFERRDLMIAVAIRTAQGDEGVLIGAISRADLWGRVRPMFAAAAWVFAITAFVFVGFGAWLLRRRIVLPIREIARASKEIADGRLATRVAASGSTELEELGEHFNEMATSLERQRRALVEAERSLARHERLASVGCLAAGLAHEVGNPVSAILGFSEVVLANPRIESRTRTAVEGLRVEALRIRTLVRELLDLSRAEEVRLERHPVEPLLRSVVERMRAQPSAGDVAIEVAIADGLPAVWTDARRVEQVLVNLLDNAVHAAKPTRGPRVEVHAGVQAAAFGTPGRRRGDPEPEAGVSIDVIDNGPGIPADHLPRVFDPFFTTKDPGSGTGLGLWNAHRISDLIGGRLEVASEPGRTRFSLILPLADTGKAHVCSAPSDRG